MKTAASTLILCMAALLGLGMVMLYSCSMTVMGARFLLLQSGWSAVGILVCACAAFLDYRWLKRINVPLFIGAVILLGAVFLPAPIGIHVKGSSRWVHLGIGQFQPSELAKIALIVTLACYCEKFQKHIRSFRRGLVVPGCIALVALIPIYSEPDRGTTILLGAVTLLMLLIAGARWIYVIPPAGLGAAFFSYILLHDPVRRARIMSWWYPDDHKTGAGYQAWQAMLALGNGGISGLGLGNGRQKLGFIPEQHTDFILSLIGEELGVIATIAVVCAFILFIICGVYIACHSRDLFGLLLGGGLTFLIGMQAFINIGVVTSTLPNKGLALPFVSYGGSSLVTMFAAVGLLLSIARHSSPPSTAEEEIDDRVFQSAQYA
jgi:cell division protein FtsW